MRRQGEARGKADEGPRAAAAPPASASPRARPPGCARTCCSTGCLRARAGAARVMHGAACWRERGAARGTPRPGGGGLAGAARTAVVDHGRQQPERGLLGAAERQQRQRAQVVHALAVAHGRRVRAECEQHAPQRALAGRRGHPGVARERARQVLRPRARAGISATSARCAGDCDISHQRWWLARHQPGASAAPCCSPWCCMVSSPMPMLLLRRGGDCAHAHRAAGACGAAWSASGNRAASLTAPRAVARGSKLTQYQ